MPETRVDEEDVLVLTQQVVAPPEEIFPYLIEPEKILTWMGMSVDVEPRPGGKFWIRVNETDVVVGQYLEVEPPQRVIFTWGWEGSIDVPPGSSTVTITLIPNTDTTTVELRHSGLPGGGADDHRKGWAALLPRLADAAHRVSRDSNPHIPDK